MGSDPCGNISEKKYLFFDLENVKYIAGYSEFEGCDSSLTWKVAVYTYH